MYKRTLKLSTAKYEHVNLETYALLASSTVPYLISIRCQNKKNQRDRAKSYETVDVFDFSV